MKQREFLNITRTADSIARERQEKYNLSSEDFQEDRSEMIVDMVEQQVKELVETTNSSIASDEIVKGIVSGLLRSHRHLQSEFIQSLHKALGEYAKSGTDLRNASVVEMAGRMYIAGDTYELTPSQLASKLGRG
jgi:ribosome biogenesis protein Nip4